MADTATVAKELEAWLLDAVHKGNAVTLEAMKVLTDAVQPVTAVVPIVAPPLMFDFAEKLASSERKFVIDTVHMTERFMPVPPKPASK